MDWLSVVIKVQFQSYYLIIIKRKMKKDEESLLRMNFLIQAANIYKDSYPQYSQHFIYQFIQVSEKKMIRIDKTMKRRINKNDCTFREMGLIKKKTRKITKKSNKAVQSKDQEQNQRDQMIDQKDQKV